MKIPVILTSTAVAQINVRIGPAPTSCNLRTTQRALPTGKFEIFDQRIQVQGNSTSWFVTATMTCYA